MYCCSNTCETETRKCWVYLVEEKTEVFPVSRNFHAFSTTQTSLKLKCLRIADGGEYLALDLPFFVQKMELKESLQLPAIQHLMVWLNDTIGHCVKGFDVCCPQLISLMHFGARLYKLQLIDPHTIHIKVAYQRRFV